jgi:hypothetical protein
MQTPSRASDRTRKDAEEKTPVVVIQEYGLTLVPAARHVPQGPRMLQAQWPSHH